MKYLKNCENNPTVDKKKLAKLTTNIKKFSEFQLSLPKSFDILIEEQKNINQALLDIEHFYQTKNYSQAYASLVAVWEKLGFTDNELIAKQYTRLKNKGKINQLLFSYQNKKLNGEKINSLAITPDGQFLVSGSQDKTIKVWENGLCIRTFDHGSIVTSLAITPNAWYVLSGSFDKTIKIWILDSGRCLRTLVGHTEKVTSIAISSNGWYIVSGSLDKTIKIWVLKTGQCLHTLWGHIHGVTSVAISPNGKQIVSGSVDNTLKVWENEKCILTLKGHTAKITSIAFSPDGQNIISGSEDTSLQVRKLKTGQCLHTLIGHTDKITSVIMTPDGQYIISGSQNEIKIWSNKGECVHTLARSARTLALSPDSQVLFLGNDENIILYRLIWQLDFPKENWDNKVIFYLQIFMDRHKEYWTKEDWQALLTELQSRSFGWISPDKIEFELKQLRKKKFNTPQKTREVHKVQEKIPKTSFLKTLLSIFQDSFHSFPRITTFLIVVILWWIWQI